MVQRRKAPVAAIRTPSGAVLLEVQLASAAKSALAVVYGCVSLHDRRPDRDRQVAAMTEWAASQTVVVSGVLSEVGSDMNGRRCKPSDCGFHDNYDRC